LILFIGQARANEATWAAGTTDWNTGTNWSTGVVPGENDIANFGTQLPLHIYFSGLASVGQINFIDGAIAYIFMTGPQFLRINHGGIFNVSNSTQTFNISQYGTLEFLNNAMSSSNIVVNNVGTVAFFNNSYAGSTTYNNALGSRMGLTDFSNLQTAAVDNKGSMTFNNNSTGGNATITNDQGGTLCFYVNSDAGNSTITNLSTITFFNDSSARSANITNNAGGTISFQNASRAENAIILNSGTLTFTDTSTAENATCTNKGTMTFSGNSSASASKLVNNGTMSFTDSSTTGIASLNNIGILKFVGNSSSNGGSISNASTATVDLTGLATPELNLGSLNGGGSVVLGAQTLVVGGLNQDMSFSGVISGTGGLMKDGTGALTLSGVNTYTGSTTAQNGVLVNTGKLISPVNVNTGATYQGSGSSGALTNAGLVSPQGSLTINGNFTQAATGTYQVSVSAAGSDSLIITGQANLDGTLKITPTGNVADFTNKNFTILSATNGMKGEFATKIIPSIFDFQVKYLKDSIVIDITKRHFSMFVRSPIAAHLDDVIAAKTVTSDLHQVINALANISFQSIESMREALNQLSPDVYRELSFLSFDQANLARDAVHHQQNKLIETYYLKEFSQIKRNPNNLLKNQFYNALQRRQKLMPVLSLQQTEKLIIDHIPISQNIQVGKTNVWLEPFGQIHRKSGRAGTKSRTYGTSLGGDIRVCQNTYLGLMGGVMNTPFNWLQNRGWGKVSNVYGGIYGLWMSQEGIYVDGQALGGASRYHTHRSINFLGRTAEGKHRGFDVSADLEAGYVLALQSTVLQPFVNVGYASFHEKAFQERGAGSINVRINNKTAQFLRTELGSLFSQIFTSGETLIYPTLRLSWVKKQPLNKSGHKINFAFEGQSLNATIRGDNKVKNLFRAGLGLTTEFKGGFYVSGDVSGAVGSGEKSGELMLALGYNF
jgi:outer membrane autotransporter protein